MKILCIGDVIGNPGRRALQQLLPSLIQQESIDFVVANGENAAGGFGITDKVFDEFLQAGVDVVTSGNHIWDKKEVDKIFEKGLPLLRPLNYPDSDLYPLPGKGAIIHRSKSGIKVAVLNLMGRVFMDWLDCPFQRVEKELEILRKETKIIILDMHAEASSEKQAMGWIMDGRVSIVFGTHTHVPTADERILPGGTAYVTDVGMTGGYDSIIGMDKKQVIQKMLTRRPVKYEVAEQGIELRAFLVDVEEETGKSRSVKRMSLTLHERT